MPILRNLRSGADLAAAVDRVRSPFDRTIGWLAAARIAPHEGKWFDPCWAIHTLGMRSAIDVIFLNRDAQVIELRPGVLPHRLSIANRRAESVIEMGPGFLVSAAIAIGDRLTLVEALPARKDRST